MALMAAGLSVGVRVCRGPDWKWNNQDDGEGELPPSATLSNLFLDC